MFWFKKNNIRVDFVVFGWDPPGEALVCVSSSLKICFAKSFLGGLSSLWVWFWGGEGGSVVLRDTGATWAWGQSWERAGNCGIWEFWWSWVFWAALGWDKVGNLGLGELFQLGIWEFWWSCIFWAAVGVGQSGKIKFRETFPVWNWNSGEPASSELLWESTRWEIRI